MTSIVSQHPRNWRLALSKSTWAVLTLVEEAKQKHTSWNSLTPLLGENPPYLDTSKDFRASLNVSPEGSQTHPD